jgi:hypothetical protein
MSAFSNTEVAEYTANLDDATARKLAEQVISAAAASEDGKIEVSMLRQTDDAAADAAGIPCIVSVRTPFGCICLVPPGGDC